MHLSGRSVISIGWDLDRCFKIADLENLEMSTKPPNFNSSCHRGEKEYERGTRSLSLPQTKLSLSYTALVTSGRLRAEKVRNGGVT